MNCNYKNNNTEYSNFPIKTPLTIKERNYIENVLDSIANCTHVRELVGTPAYITDPHKEFGLTNMRTNKINCIMIDPAKGLTSYNCYSYDLMLFLGGNNAKIINFDYDKVFIFCPGADRSKQAKPTLNLTCFDESNKPIDYKIYGKVIIAGVDWVTNSFISLSGFQRKEISETFKTTNKFYLA